MGNLACWTLGCRVCARFGVEHSPAGALSVQYAQMIDVLLTVKPSSDQALHLDLFTCLLFGQAHSGSQKNGAAVGPGLQQALSYLDGDSCLASASGQYNDVVATGRSCLHKSLLVVPQLSIRAAPSL